MPETISITPAFAREASDSLRSGDIQRAIDLCIAGTKVFPFYPTGYLILGKCYEAYGRTREALVQYQQALNRLPDNPMLKDAVKRLEDLQQEEFRTALAEQEKRFASSKPAEVRRVEVRQAPPRAEAREEETTVEFLSKRLKNVKRIQPLENAAGGSAEEPREANLRFATPTMADILASQGRYAEAIAAYREIVAKDPDEKYQKRLAELERLYAGQKKEGSPGST